MSDSDDVRYRKFKDEEGPKDDRSTRENGESSTQVLVEDSHNSSLHEANLSISNDFGEGFDDTAPILGGPEYTGGCGFFCNPQSLCHKGIALLLMCSVGFGSYFCYDNPGALQVNQS
jgi:hypothetical protein